MFSKKISGHEGGVKVKKDKVIKTFNSNYFMYNRLFYRRGEQYYLGRYKSPCFIEMLSYDDKSITLKNGGKSIGVMERITLPGLDKKHFLKWLKKLKKALAKHRIYHRDINPTNILYNEDTDEFKLIDFAWAVRKEDVGDKPSILNPFAKNDKEAIVKLRKQIKCYEQ